MYDGSVSKYETGVCGRTQSVFEVFAGSEVGVTKVLDAALPFEALEDGNWA